LYGGRLDRELLRRLATPLLLWALGSAFLVYLGFVHGGSDQPLVTAMNRFSHLLPGDNYLPLYFAEYFSQHGHHGTPPDYASFLSSDRPPLQIGYALSQWKFGWSGSQLDYQVLGVMLQQLWIVGLWALLLAARVGRVTRGLAMVTVLVSDLAIVNGFFVWPKLLPAAMLLALAALVLTPLWPSLRRSLWGAALVAALCGLAMLGHGSSVFGVIPLLAIAAFRGLPSWRWLGVAALVGIVLMGSWSQYQKHGDPPGNRLTKWSLAGVPEIDDRGTMEAIFDAYGEAGLGGAIDNKVQNFVTMSGGKMAYENVRAGLESGHPTILARAVRTNNFFYLLPSLGLLLLAPFVMAAAYRRGRRNPAEWRLALMCWLALALGAVAWGLLLFGNEIDRTIVHVSSYLLPLLGLVGGVVGLRATFPRFALYYVGLSAALSLALYAPALDPIPGSSYSVVAILLCALALAAFGFLAFRREELRPAGGEAGEDDGRVPRLDATSSLGSPAPS
ncbi:MAG TPA: hypothetical protein VG458_08360, partial [Solirubrobacterales bacterium]|nr:hypothetical protein [Solirubrobacterales bacterium]